MTQIERTAHPKSCTGCRHELTYGVIQCNSGRTTVNGQCLHQHRGEWPDGCRHYVERAR